jgi:hypothetical protein
MDAETIASEALEKLDRARMAKFTYHKDEMYPVYWVEPAEKRRKKEIIELTEDEVARIEAAQKEFEACQDLIESRIKTDGG